MNGDTGSSSNLKFITLDELRENNGKDGKPYWILIDGKVYDVTNYNHPGGKEVWEQPDPNNNYIDLYEDFMNADHSSTANRLMKKYIIGELEK
jgi:cytochrome b involved in lipid metabolism